MLDRYSNLTTPGVLQNIGRNQNPIVKTAAPNLTILRRLDGLGRLELPILVGPSRKSFIGHLTDAPPQRRLPGSLAAVAWAAHHRAAVVRVHDVAETLQFLDIWQAIHGADT